MFWILTDYSDRSFSFNDLAFFADRLYRWSYFHWKSSFRKFIKICSFLSAQIHTTHAFGLYTITPKYKMQALFCVKSHFFIFSPIFTHITSQFHPHPIPNLPLPIPYPPTTSISISICIPYLLHPQKNSNYLPISNSPLKKHSLFYQ